MANWSSNRLRIPSQRPALLPALTAVRGPLAWLVVAFHFGDLQPFRDAVGGVHRPPLSNGPLAVDCFFVLSGFILFHVHSSLGQRLDGREIREFLWFRLVRLYPVHLAVLLAFVLSVEGLALLTGVRPNAPIRFSLVAFIEHVLLIHGWGITTLLTWNYPSWSISSEWAAYLAAPFFFWGALRLRGAALLALVAATALALGELLAHGVPSLRWAIPRVWLGFILGTLICRLRDLYGPTLLPWRKQALAFFWICFVGLLFTRQGGPLVCAFSGLMLFHGLPSEAAPAPAGASHTGPMARLLVYLGETSYAVYMGHAFVENVWLTIARKLGLIAHCNIVLLGLVLVALIQGFAMLLHHAVEEPARKRLRRLGKARLAPALADRVLNNRPSIS